MQTQTSPTKRHKTRAEVARDRVVIRLALDTAGPEIGKLLAENGVVLEGANWEKCFPNWLIATDGEAVIGCVQVMPAKPLGWLECLYVSPTAPFKMRAIAIRKLLGAGMATCHAAGCAYIAGMVDEGNLKFENVLTKLNFVRTGDFKMLAKRLTE